jgi:hypothetical protein
MSQILKQAALSMVLSLPLTLSAFAQAPIPVPSPGAYASPVPVPAYAPAPLIPAPSTLTIPMGTFLTVEVNDRLSTDRSHPGDAFNAILSQPIVVDGWVVARAGQPVIGRVVSVQKAGRISGKSDIAIELGELVLVDGQQVPVRTQVIQHQGNSSTGRDFGAIAATTAIGALIGAGVDGGSGAAIGAGIGAGAGVAGVLATPGDATRIHPESTLAFRLDDPVTISTVRSAHAFLPVTAADYRTNPAPRIRVAEPVVYAPPPSVIVVPDRYPRRYRRY